MYNSLGGCQSGIMAHYNKHYINGRCHDIKLYWIINFTANLKLLIIMSRSHQLRSRSANWLLNGAHDLRKVSTLYRVWTNLASPSQRQSKDSPTQQRSNAWLWIASHRVVMTGSGSGLYATWWMWTCLSDEAQETLDVFMFMVTRQNGSRSLKTTQ